MSPPQKGDSRERVLRGIFITVSALWIIGNAVQIIDPTRPVPTSVNVVMGIIVTAWFSASVGKQLTKNGSGGNGAPDS